MIFKKKVPQPSPAQQETSPATTGITPVTSSQNPPTETVSGMAPPVPVQELSSPTTAAVEDAQPDSVGYAVASADPIQPTPADPADEATVGATDGTNAEPVTQDHVLSHTVTATEQVQAPQFPVALPHAFGSKLLPVTDIPDSHPVAREISVVPGTVTLPDPYFLAGDGSLCRRLENGDHVQITVGCPISPVSIMRTIDGDQWSLEVRYRDADGKPHDITFPLSEVLAGKKAMAAKLADTGLQIVPDKVDELIGFIQACRPDQRVIVTTQAGWLGQDHQVFVTPHAIIGDTGNEKVVLRQEANSPTRNSVHGTGTLSDWQAIALLASRYPLALFVMLAAFTGPLLKLLRLDGGGFHFFGASSRGKTTLLQVAASVWGKGSDPTRDSRSFVQRWLLTVNALEALASCHSDMLACLDELGSFLSTGDLGQVVYMLAGGAGKAVMNSHRQLKQTRSWSGNILSSGEKTIAEAILEGGKGLKAGHLVRIIDVLGWRQLLRSNGRGQRGGGEQPQGEVRQRLWNGRAGVRGAAHRRDT